MLLNFFDVVLSKHRRRVAHCLVSILSRLPPVRGIEGGEVQRSYRDDFVTDLSLALWHTLSVG